MPDPPPTLHNLRDTLNPMCLSNDGVEDTEHFLLHCHSYDACRTDLLDSVSSTLQPYDLPNLSNTLMLKLILYGDENLKWAAELFVSRSYCLEPI